MEAASCGLKIIVDPPVLVGTTVSVWSTVNRSDCRRGGGVRVPVGEGCLWRSARIVPNCEDKPVTAVSKDFNLEF